MILITAYFSKCRLFFIRVNSGGLRGSGERVSAMTLKRSGKISKTIARFVLSVMQRSNGLWVMFEDENLKFITDTHVPLRRESPFLFTFITGR